MPPSRPILRPLADLAFWLLAASIYAGATALGLWLGGLAGPGQ